LLTDKEAKVNTLAELTEIKKFDGLKV